MGLCGTRPNEIKGLRGKSGLWDVFGTGGTGRMDGGPIVAPGPFWRVIVGCPVSPLKPRQTRATIGFPGDSGYRDAGRANWGIWPNSDGSVGVRAKRPSSHK